MGMRLDDTPDVELRWVEVEVCLSRQVREVALPDMVAEERQLMRCVEADEVSKRPVVGEERRQADLRVQPFHSCENTLSRKDMRADPGS